MDSKMKSNKWLIIGAVCFILAMLTLAANAAGPATNIVTLVWDPPAPMPYSVTIRIYSSTNAAAPLPWTVVTNVAVGVTNVAILMEKKMTFFYATSVNATNTQWESDPSNVALAPWPYPSGNFSIRKGL